MNAICNRVQNCWIEKFVNALRFWSEDDLRLVVSYSKTIIAAVEDAFRSSPVRDLEKAHSKLECLECEEQAYFADVIRKYRPSRKRLYQWVHSFSSFRMKAWFPSLVRQGEAVYIQDEHSTPVYGENQELLDSGFKDPQGSLLITPKAPHQAPPDKILLAKEDLRVLKKVISEIEESAIPHACVYARILRMQLEGIDVGREHADILGVLKTEVASMKFWAFRLACELMAEYDPDLIEAQKRYREQKAKEWDIETTLFADRLAQYGLTEEQLKEREPRTIRDWRVTTGAIRLKRNAKP